MNLQSLVEKIDEYEQELDSLRNQNEQKTHDIELLKQKIAGTDHHIHSLEVELEKRNETISIITDELNLKIQQKEKQKETEIKRLQEKHQKELVHLKNSQIDSEDHRNLLMNELNAVKAENTNFVKEMAKMRESRLIRQCQP